MGRLEDVEKQYKDSYKAVQAQSVNPLNRAIARAVLNGSSTTEIADRFGITFQRASQIRNSPIVKQEVARIEQKLEDAVIERELKGLATRSVEVIAQELYSEIPSKRRTDSAFKILDRTGYHPKTDKTGDDNRQMNFITLAPLPGESPEQALERVSQFKDYIDIEAEEDLAMLEEMEEEDESPSR